MSGIADAYSRTGAAWRDGPERVYARLAIGLVEMAPVPVAGRLVVDLGAGTGAASRALAAAGAAPIAVDYSHGMLLVDRTARPPAVVGDATALPLADASVGGVVAAFSLNHLTDPVAGLRECRRVCRAGSPVVASAYASDDQHPTKQAAETAAREHGWEPEDWIDGLRNDAMPRLATIERAQAACDAAGLAGAVVTNERMAFADLGPLDLARWRLGMPFMAPFMATRSAPERQAIERRAVELLDGAPPLVRSIIVITAIT